MRFLFVLSLLISSVVLISAPSTSFAQAAKQGTLISAGDMSGNVTSDAIDYLSYPLGSIQAVFTGAPVGTFVIQTSGDSTNTPASVVNWTDYASSTLAISAAGNTEWILTGIGYRWVRLKYTRTSGTGTLNATWTRKAGN